MTGFDATAPSVRRARAHHVRGISGPIRRAWARVTEPRHMSVVYGGVYTVAALIGVATFLVPPTTIAGELGPMLSSAWAALFIVGGVLGMSTVLPGWWKWERWAIALNLAAIGIYGYVVITLHFTATGSRLTQLGVLVLAALLFIVRWLLIRGRTYGPRR